MSNPRIIKMIYLLTSLAGCHTLTRSHLSKGKGGHDRVWGPSNQHRADTGEPHDAPHTASHFPTPASGSYDAGAAGPGEEGHSRARTCWQNDRSLPGQVPSAGGHRSDVTLRAGTERRPCSVSEDPECTGHTCPR